MRNVIASLLEKRGIKSIEELKPHEKAKFDTWMKIFEKEIKVEDIARFLKAEIQRLEEAWLETDDKNPLTYIFEWKKNIEVKGRLRNYKNLLLFIEAPEQNKQKLEKYLTRLINK